MHTVFNRILGMALAALSFFAMTSCVNDDLPEDSDNGSAIVPGEDAMLVFRIKLPDMPATRAGEGTYEPGTGYENYINTTEEGLRIYLFGNDDKFIMRFIPMLLSPSGGEFPDTYTAVGKLTSEIESLKDFKVVVLANWPTYADSDLIPGVSTIDDLCDAESSQFNRLTEYGLDPDKGLVIPFFGVHQYSGVTFEKGKRTTLSEPVSLLRAMAKVEVVFDNPGLSLDDVILHGLNSKGYCAPKGINSQDGYDHNGQWSLDYVRTLHLVGDANEPNATNNYTHLLCKNRADGERKETWVCYVPEYRNTLVGGGPAEDRAWLELQLDVPGIILEKIFFTDYDDNHKSSPGTDFDIHRNNCYRFNVSLGKGGLIIKVQKWENAYDNKFTFE